MSLLCLDMVFQVFSLLVFPYVFVSNECALIVQQFWPSNARHKARRLFAVALNAVVSFRHLIIFGTHPQDH